MSGDPSERRGPTPVTIFGRTYQLRGDQDPEVLRDLARLVDGKMNEVAEATGTADSLKVAILASLNIANDYLEARRGVVPSPGEEDETRVRLARLVTLLDEALAG